MSDLIKGAKVPEDDLVKAERSLGYNLIAFFMVLQDDVLSLLEKAGKEGWTTEQFMHEATSEEFMSGVAGDGDGISDV